MNDDVVDQSLIERLRLEQAIRRAMGLSDKLGLALVSIRLSEALDLLRGTDVKPGALHTVRRTSIRKDRDDK